MTDSQHLAEELREYTAMKYMGDCKCGKCQLVPRALVERIYHTLNGSGPVAQRAPEPAAYSVDWTFKKSDPSFSAGGGSCVHWGSDKDDYKAHLEKLRGLDFVESITITPLYAGPSVPSTLRGGGE